MRVDPPPAHRGARLLLAVLLTGVCTAGVTAFVRTGAYDVITAEGVRIVEEARALWRQ